MSRFPLPPPEPSTTARWSSAAFQAELSGWCATVLGTPVRLEQHKLRAWSTVCRVHAGSRVLYTKQNCPQQRFEAALVEELARIVPGHVPPPVAVDRERGFLLTDDQGPVLGDGEADLDTWAEVLRQWALLQRAVVPHLRVLEGIGVPAMRTTDAEEYTATRTAQLAALPAADPRHLDADTARRIEAHLPVVRRWSDEVAGLGLPMTLNHNDLHANNVFAEPGPVGLRFFDLGDALLTEPIAVLLIPLHVLSMRLGAAAHDPRLEKLASAFLEVWSDQVPMNELRAALPAALQLGRLCRQEAWARTMPSMTGAELAEWGEAAPRWLETLLDDPPLR